MIYKEHWSFIKDIEGLKEIVYLSRTLKVYKGLLKVYKGDWMVIKDIKCL